MSPSLDLFRIKSLYFNLGSRCEFPSNSASWITVHQECRNGLEIMGNEWQIAVYSKVTLRELEYTKITPVQTICPTNSEPAIDRNLYTSLDKGV
jgi:hypothetical protein